MSKIPESIIQILKEANSAISLLYNDLLRTSDKKEVAILKNKIQDTFNNYFKAIKNIKPEYRKLFGEQLNNLKQEYQEKITSYVNKLEQESWSLKDSEFGFDISRPLTEIKDIDLFINRGKTFKHPLSKELELMHSIWRRLGYKVFEGRELDLDYYVFEALNIPKGHPAREMWDTFYTKEGYVPTTQTSNMQIRMMKYFKQVPVKAAIYGKVFRNEDLDATHSHTFYQYEIVYIDKHLHIGHLIGTLVEFLKIYYDTSKLEYRIMPAHFPFVEPGIEIHLKRGNKWLEILGAGMIHPIVLNNGGFNPDQYTGFAAGFGIDRMVMLKYGLKDIRDLYMGNLSMYAS